MKLLFVLFPFLLYFTTITAIDSSNVAIKVSDPEFQSAFAQVKPQIVRELNRNAWDVYYTVEKPTEPISFVVETDGTKHYSTMVVVAQRGFGIPTTLQKYLVEFIITSPQTSQLLVIKQVK